MLQNTKTQCPVPCPLGGMGWGKAGPDLGWAEGWLYSAFLEVCLGAVSWI